VEAHLETSPLVLLVDDEPSLRQTVAFMLEMEGFRVATAEDGEQALERVRALRPSVVLLDAMLPRRHGFDVCREIKADPALAGVRVVMLTALVQKNDRERAVAAGADYYMGKPFDEEELFGLLRRLTTAT
jgi:CheY-like chemotaxis protein